MDKLAAMRAFVEIAERGSLTAAGKALDRSLPAMVRVLAELEQELGVVLIRRTTRRQSLTAEGAAYLERCKRILADVREAEELVGAGGAEPRGLLRVTAPVLFGQRHVAPAVFEFVQRFEQVQVELMLLDRVVDLVDESIDVAVRIGARDDSGLMVTSVGSMRRVVCATPRLLKQVGIPARPEALGDKPCIRYSTLMPGSVWRFADAGRERSVRVSGRLIANSTAAAADACAAGLGFGQFLAYQVWPYVRSGTLRVVLQEFEVPPLPVSLVYPEARLPTSRLRAFLDWMKPRLRELPELAHLSVSKR